MSCKYKLEKRLFKDTVLFNLISINQNQNYLYKEKAR